MEKIDDMLSFMYRDKWPIVIGYTKHIFSCRSCMTCKVQGLWTGMVLMWPAKCTVFRLKIVLFNMHTAVQSWRLCDRHDHCVLALTEK